MLIGFAMCVLALRPLKGYTATMRLLTYIVILVVVVIVAIIATAIVVRRSAACGGKRSGEQQSWLDKVLTRVPNGASTAGGVQPAAGTPPSEPGMLGRIKALFHETSRRYETSERTRGAFIESEQRRGARALDLDEDRIGDVHRGVSRGTARPKQSRRKRKRGDVRERQRKLAYEARCRQIMERLFSARFPKVRPAWLRNELRDSRTGTGTNHKLELDCYNEELAVALEYNGRQHRVYPNTWHETKKDFDDQQRRDRLKVVRCEEEGVRLVVVPDAEIVPYDELYTYITEELERLGVVEIEP